jgi:uncharacterized protein with PIN domain
MRDPIYIDTSSLLKTLWEEPESAAVDRAVADEDQVVVSSLTKLETEVQIRSRWLAGAMTQARHKSYRDAFLSYREMAPFVFLGLSGGVFGQAVKQDAGSGKVHCRTLDRLHLAAMEELGVRRLLTNDAKQAAAAKALGYEVFSPGAESHPIR